MLKIFNSLGLLSQFLSKIGWGQEKSGSVAKERLRLVLIHDQAKVSPELLETLRGEIIDVISKYMEIDTQALEMGIEQRDGSVALAANIPIVRLKREKIAAAIQNQTAAQQHTTGNSSQHRKLIRKTTKKYYSGKGRPLQQTTPRV